MGFFDAFDPGKGANRVKAWQLNKDKKDGKELAPDRASWLAAYDAWVASGKPKPPKAAPSPEDAEPLLDEHPAPEVKVAPPPPPPLDAPPKVEPDLPRPPKGKAPVGKAGGKWQTKYQPDLKAMTGMDIKIVGADGKEVAMEPREMMCVGCASVATRLLAWAEEGLSKIDKKPLGGISAGQLFGSAVLFFDEVLPDAANITPERFFVAGATTILVSRLYHYKAIGIAEKAGEARAANLAEMKRRTDAAEAAHRAAQDAASARAAAVAPPSPPSPPPPPPPPHGDSVKVSETPLVMEGPARFVDAPEGFDLKREWDLKPDDLV